jgi:hypothetical protein
LIRIYTVNNIQYNARESTPTGEWMRERGQSYGPRGRVDEVGGRELKVPAIEALTGDVDERHEREFDKLVLENPPGTVARPYFALEHVTAAPSPRAAIHGAGLQGAPR